MKRRLQRVDLAGPRSTASLEAESSTSAVDSPVAAGAGDGAVYCPYHDPSVHTEREPFSVTSQRCRGEYP
jgi:hypothetical protein